MTRATRALLFSTVIVYSVLYIPQPILPLLTRAFGVPPATAGLTISVVVLAIAVSSGVHGVLSDRFGRRPVMVTSCALLAVPTLLCGLAPGFGALLAFRALQGLLIPGVTAVAVAWLGDEFPGAALGRQVGLWIAASVLGGLLGRVVTGPVAEAWGWHAPFLLFGGLTVAGAGALARTMPRRPAPGRRGETWSGALAHFGNPRLLGAFVVGAAVFFGFIGVFTYLPYRLTAPPFGMRTGAVSSVYFVYLAGAATSIAAPRLTRRFGARAVMGSGFVVASAGVALTALRTIPGVVLALAVLCVGMFLVQAVAPVYVNRAAGTATGAANALYLSFYYVGATLGAFLPGHALQSWGWPGVVGSCIGVFLVGLAADLAFCR